jgi:hypothetical protein
MDRVQVSSSLFGGAQGSLKTQALSFSSTLPSKAWADEDALNPSSYTLHTLNPKP